MQAELRLETAPVLELRKILDSSIPAHQDIIAQSLAAMAESQDDDENAPPALTNARARVKAELRIKPERKTVPNPSVTDLTAPLVVKPEPGTAGTGVAGAANFCDLTGDEDEPMWTSKAAKRTRVD